MLGIACSSSLLTSTTDAQGQQQMDPDSPWEDDPRESHVPDVEWTKITSEFTNSGYREGIIAGKEAFLQEGFDAGFARVGAPLGRELGNLRGTVAAIGALLKSQSQDSPELEELCSISSILSTILFSDIAPRDLEAEQHAKEHFNAPDDPVTSIESAFSLTDTAAQERRTIDIIAELKQRLASLCKKLGLPVLAQDISFRSIADKVRFVG